MEKIINNKEELGVGFWTFWLKPILSKSGENAGYLWNLQFRSGKLVNITIFHRFKMIMMDAKYIRNMESLDSEKKIVLSIDPIYLIKGRFVFDGSGEKLGRVSSLEQLGYHNDFDSILVRKKFYLPSVRISKSKIKTLNKNIILSE